MIPPDEMSAVTKEANSRSGGLVVSATQMGVYVLKGHGFSRAANGLK
jgi:hypothetical protein